MRAFLAVFGREVIERRLLFLVALLVGLVPLAAPLLPGAASQNPDDLRGSVALILSALLTLALSAILGATIISRDLAERRLGFYFARPIPGWSLWAGKLAAAMALVVSAGLLILAPAWLAGADLETALGSVGIGFGYLPGGVVTILTGLLLILLATHAVSVVLRARSPWLAVDLTALAVMGWGVGSILGGLRLAGAGMVAMTILVELILVTLLALLAATAAQVTQGRTDSRRAHRWLSLTFWPLMLASLLGAGAYSRWVLAMEPADLDRIYGAEAAPSGPWISVTGMDSARSGYEARFLVDTSSGRFLRARDTYSGNRWVKPLFSHDGRWAAWLERRAGIGGFEVVRAALRDPNPRSQRLAVSYPEVPLQWALSPSGSRLAALFGDRLTVDDLAAGRLVASAKVPAGLVNATELRFGADEVLRLYAWEDSAGAGEPTWELRIWELDARRGRLALAGRVPGFVEGEAPVFSPDGLRLLDFTSGLGLFDARTGASLGALPSEPEPGKQSSTASFLHDGRIVWILKTGEGMELRLLTPALGEIRRFSFPNSRKLFLGGEYVPGRLVVCVAFLPLPSGVAKRIEARWLDLATGEQRAFARGLVPAGEPGLGPQSAGSRLFHRGYRLIWLDPETGRERVVANGLFSPLP